MNRKLIATGCAAALLCCATTALRASDSIPPVTPNASPEAASLLRYLYSISGKKVLTGQHCVPLVGSLRLVGVHRQTKHYPAVFGQDFGFDAPGSWDGINYRQQIVDEAIRRHQEGFIITLMWHAVRPLDDEPVTFSASIQGELTEEEWKSLITPGTNLNERWKAQVDVIAWHLKQLRNANVPVLWRPYHEMNGEWFWWGKKAGENGYKKLYRMLFERLVSFHGLNNLLWVFNTNEVKANVEAHETYFPGHDVVDIFATDVYTQGFDSLNYAQLLKLAGDKPIALGEVGNPPTVEILQQQPRWTWFMSWGDPEGTWREQDHLRAVYAGEEALTLEELPWSKLTQVKMHFPVLK